MCVRNEDVRHGLAAHGVELGFYVLGIIRPRIDDRDLAFADHIRERALEGERPAIVGENAAHAWHDLLGMAGREVERSVESDIVGHGSLVLCV